MRGSWVYPDGNVMQTVVGAVSLSLTWNSTFIHIAPFLHLWADWLISAEENMMRFQGLGRTGEGEFIV
jgi:hypothetical protein